VATDEQWNAFCDVIGNPDWTREERFSDALSRYGNQPGLDELIEGWTIDKDPYDVMHLLQASGIAAAPVTRQSDLFSDPHLAERGFFEEIDHREAGKQRVPGMGFRYSKAPLTYRMSAMCLGEHNDYVYGELLGMSSEEIAQLEEEEYIGDAYLPDLP